MKKYDIFILVGLIASLALFIALTTKTTLQQNDAVLENQKLIIELSNSTKELSAQHQLLGNRDTTVLQFLRSNFDESYLEREEFQYKQANETVNKLDMIIDLLNSSLNR